MNTTEIKKDVANKKLNITREFAAPVEKVWKAWTDNSILDKWWAPRPWKAVTKTMDFRAGGVWLYNMLGPDGNGAWCRVDFNSVTPESGFTTTASFCDENGNVNADFPPMYWDVNFEPSSTGTQMKIEITFDAEADMQKIIEMGFEQGFTMGLSNLDEVLAAA